MSYDHNMSPCKLTVSQFRAVDKSSRIRRVNAVGERFEPQVEINERRDDTELCEPEPRSHKLRTRLHKYRHHIVLAKSLKVGNTTMRSAIRSNAK